MPREAVQIKGTRNGLLICLYPHADFEEIKENLRQKMDGARGFFKGARFALHPVRKSISAGERRELEELLTSYGLIPTLMPQPAPATSRPPGEPAHLVRHSLRSGQRVKNPGHVVVLGDVKPGAEIEAGGSILILGKCLGTVRAGVGGNRDACVVACLLAPAALAIAGVEYRGPVPAAGKAGLQVASLGKEGIVFNGAPATHR
ncbi:MAG: septum site-determining protein MinC [Bacillota bacterium]